MAQRRIFQVAKELNISHTDILNFLKEKNIKVTSHMAPIDDETYQIILSNFIKIKSQLIVIEKSKFVEKFMIQDFLNSRKQIKN